MMETESQRKRSDWDGVKLEERSFLKMKSIMEKDGYREGVEEGRNSIFQKHFDEGYKDGFKNGFLLGILKGTTKAELNSKQFGSTLGLEETTIGACILCKDENIHLPIERIRADQTEVLQTLIASIKQENVLKKVNVN